MIFDVTVELEKAQQAEERIINYADGLEKAFSNRFDETVRSTRARTDREISTIVAVEKVEELTKFCVSQDLIDNQLQKETLLKIDDTRSLPLAAFKARQTPEGVEIEFARGVPAELYEGAFGPKIPKLGGNIYRRAGKKRFPLVKLRDIKVKEIEGVDRAAFDAAKRHAEGMLRSKMREAVEDANKIIGKDKYATP